MAWRNGIAVEEETTNLTNHTNGSIRSRFVFVTFVWFVVISLLKAPGSKTKKPGSRLSPG